MRLKTLLLAGAAAFCAAPALASDVRLQGHLAPYFWAAGVSGTFQGEGRFGLSRDAQADFGDVLSNLNQVPVMITGELRYGRFALSGDLMHLSVGTSLEPSGRAFSSGRVEIDQTVGTLMGTWRALEGGQTTVDVGAGVRLVSLSSEISFDAGLLPAASRSASESWAAPLVGARIQHAFTPRLGMTLAGDVGGSTDERTWQMLGTIDWRAGERWTLRAGWRHLDLRYDGARVEQEMAISGPILGASWRF